MVMIDDLDQLLDEFEDKFHPSKETTVGNRDPHKSALSSNSTSTELDTIIKDFLDDDDDDDEVLELFQPPGEFRPSNNPSTTRELQSMISDRQKTKCYPVVLVGGCSLKMGANCTSEQRACDNLRCTSCDFKVILFNDHRWHSRSDYLFFRNNVPMSDKLRANLVRAKGTRAYACQCSWQSVDSTESVNKISGLKWVCGKHSL